MQLRVNESGEEQGRPIKLTCLDDVPDEDPLGAVTIETEGLEGAATRRAGDMGGRLALLLA